MAAADDQGFESSAETQTYTNSLIGFSITAPADWRIGETGRRVPVIELKPLGHTDLVSIQVSVHRHVGPNTPREWMDWQIANYGKRFIDIYEEFPRRSGAGHDRLSHGVRVERRTWHQGGLDGRLCAGRQDFVVRAYGTSTDFDRLRDTLDEIIGTFTLIPPDPTQAPPDDIFVLLSDEPQTLDPALHTGTVTGPLKALFGGLVRLDGNMNVIPDIAQDWSVSADGKVYTFDLRYDAYFHNGDWVTTEDVIYSWERATDPETGSSTARVYLGDIASVCRRSWQARPTRYPVSRPSTGSPSASRSHRHAGRSCRS